MEGVDLLLQEVVEERGQVYWASNVTFMGPHMLRGEVYGAYNAWEIQLSERIAGFRPAPAGGG